jgi:hypothetical protein
MNRAGSRMCISRKISGAALEQSVPGTSRKVARSPRQSGTISGQEQERLSTAVVKHENGRKNEIQFRDVLWKRSRKSCIIRQTTQKLRNSREMLRNESQGLHNIELPCPNKLWTFDAQLGCCKRGPRQLLEICKMIHNPREI